MIPKLGESLLEKHGLERGLKFHKDMRQPLGEEMDQVLTWPSQGSQKRYWDYPEKISEGPSC